MRQYLENTRYTSKDELRLTPGPMTLDELLYLYLY